MGDAQGHSYKRIPESSTDIHLLVSDEMQKEMYLFSYISPMFYM